MKQGKVQIVFDCAVIAVCFFLLLQQYIALALYYLELGDILLVKSAARFHGSRPTAPVYRM